MKIMSKIFFLYDLDVKGKKIGSKYNSHLLASDTDVQLLS